MQYIILNLNIFPSSDKINRVWREDKDAIANLVTMIGCSHEMDLGKESNLSLIMCKQFVLVLDYLIATKICPLSNRKNVRVHCNRKHCPKLQTNSCFSSKTLLLKTTRITITIAIKKKKKIISLLSMFCG